MKVLSSILAFDGRSSVQLVPNRGQTEVETDGRGGDTMILPGETEADSAGTQRPLSISD
jgi:hypothetical protein